MKGEKEGVGSGGCAVLSGAVIRFINAGLTGDRSSLLVLTHSVTSFLQRGVGSASVSLPSTCLSYVPVPASADSPSLCLSTFCSSGCLCFHLLHPSVLDYFPSSVSLLVYVHRSLFVTLPLVYACRHQWRCQTGRRPRLSKDT